jgi:hypothetical protein
VTSPWWRPAPYVLFLELSSSVVRMIAIRSAVPPLPVMITAIPRGLPRKRTRADVDARMRTDPRERALSRRR